MGKIWAATKFILRRFVEIFIVGCLLVLVPNLPPNANFKESFSVTHLPLTGKLAVNDRLNDVEIWHEGEFVGPEAFADYNGELYTGIHMGDVIKFTGDHHITPVIKFGKPCKGIYEEVICGRPLGLEFDQNGNLYVVDTYYGIFKVNIKTGDKVRLVSPKTKINGKVPKLLNALVVGKNGDIYYTDSSTDFALHDGLYTLLADPSGRLIHYDPKSRINTVLIDKLHFPNGIAFSENEDFLVINEMGKSRLIRYYLKGPKKGSHDIFLDHIPGLLDNIKADGNGGFLVSLIVSRDDTHPIIMQSLGPFPWIRKAIARVLGIIDWSFQKLDEFYPNEIFQKIIHFTGHFGSVSSAFKSNVILLRVDKNGVITDSIHNTNGKIHGISEMHVFKDTLYLGSPFNNYIARISLSKIGWDDLKGNRVKRAAPTPSSTTVKPTTTTTTRKPPTTTTTTKTTHKPTTTTSTPTTPKSASTTTTTTRTTQKPTTTTSIPTTSTTTPKPTTTSTTTVTPRTTRTNKPSTSSTTPKPATTTTTTAKPTTTQKVRTPNTSGEIKKSSSESSQSGKQHNKIESNKLPKDKEPSKQKLGEQTQQNLRKQASTTKDQPKATTAQHKP